MILTVLVNKVKSFILVFVNLFRRALCCFRRRRRSSCDLVPLTHVISNSEETKCDAQNWGDWENDVNSKPKTVQDHIELYRKQALVARQSQEASDPKEQLNFFEDMTPKITKQTKILINPDRRDNGSSSNRLNFSIDPITAVPTTLELKEWEETGWEGDTLDRDAQKVLREKKRLERERKAWEQQQKRQEKMSNRFLGSKLST